jgi:hypothetical protein
MIDLSAGDGTSDVLPSPAVLERWLRCPEVDATTVVAAVA